MFNRSGVNVDLIKLGIELFEISVKPGQHFHLGFKSDKARTKDTLDNAIPLNTESNTSISLPVKDGKEEMNVFLYKKNK